MGLCRGLVYCVAAAASAALTPRSSSAGGRADRLRHRADVVAERAGASAGWLIPLLIAGISLVDATVRGDGAARGLGCAGGFPATLLLQRVVPGT